MDRIAKFLFEVGTLRKIPRGHMQILMTSDLADNIASHSHRVSIIGYFLAKKEGANVEKVLTMSIFHDMAESRSGDQNWVHKKYVKVFEDEIIKDQFENIVDNNDLFNTINEYSKRESLESKLAKDADRLDQCLLVKEYIMLGNKQALGWISEKGAKQFYSETAKQLFNQIYKMEPQEWWDNIYTETRR